jgi:hypothetical protein
MPGGRGIKVKVADARGDAVPNAVVKFAGKWGNQQQTRGGGTTGAEGIQGLGDPQTDDRVVEIIVSLEGSKGKKERFAWVDGRVYDITLEDVPSESVNPATKSEKPAAADTSSTQTRRSWRDSVGLRGKVGWLLGILNASIDHVAANRWAYGVVGVVAAAGVSMLIGRALGLGPAFPILGFVFVFIGMFALYLFPSGTQKTWSLSFARHALVVTVTLALIALIVLAVTAAIIIVIRAGGVGAQ